MDRNERYWLSEAINTLDREYNESLLRNHLTAKEYNQRKIRNAHQIHLILMGENK